METYTILFTALAFYLLTSTLSTRFHPHLRHIPGPPLAAWSNLWRFFHTLAGHSHTSFISLHRKYGSLVRVGPQTISVSDSSEVPTIYGTSGDFTKTGFYPLQSITWGKKMRVNVFSTRDERVHREMKRKVAGAYTSEALMKMEKQVDSCGDLLMGKLRRCAEEEGRRLDLGRWLLYYTFDVVGEITFSEKLGFLETGSDIDGMIGAGGFMMMYFACVGQIPWLHKFLLGNPLLPYLIPGFEAANTGTMFTYRAMNRRSTTSSSGHLEMKEGCASDDMLSRWAGLQSRDPDKMSMTDVMVALATNIFAGADTTAISLCSLFYNLLHNPSKLRTALAEIDTATAAKKLSDPITDRESRLHLPYVNACIKEALRMHPAVGMMLERHVPQQGAVVCGKSLSPGTIVGINPWVVSYDATIFQESEKFEPERWLRLDQGGTSSEEKLAEMEKAFFVFGAGSRICMGRHLSWIEMRKIVPRILQEFEIGFEKDAEDWKIRTAWFAPQSMPEVWVRRRKA